MQTIYEDEQLIVLNKEAGIDAQKINEAYHVVHRIDQRVSGLLVMAKNATAAAALSALFQSDTIVKKYKAIVGIKEIDKTATLTHYITKNEKLKKAKANVETVKGSKKAILDYTITQQSERYMLLDITLQTGRFHQIRAQLAAIGCSVVGDLKYGYKRSTKDGSIFLQSCALAFTHPITRQKLQFELPLPEAWKQYGFE